LMPSMGFEGGDGGDRRTEKLGDGGDRRTEKLGDGGERRTEKLGDGGDRRTEKLGDGGDRRTEKLGDGGERRTEKLGDGGDRRTEKLGDGGAGGGCSSAAAARPAAYPHAMLTNRISASLMSKPSMGFEGGGAGDGENKKPGDGGGRRNEKLGDVGAGGGCSSAAAARPATYPHARAYSIMRAMRRRCVPCLAILFFRSAHYSSSFGTAIRPKSKIKK